MNAALGHAHNDTEDTCHLHFSPHVWAFLRMGLCTHHDAFPLRSSRHYHFLLLFPILSHTSHMTMNHWITSFFFLGTTSHLSSSIPPMPTTFGPSRYYIQSMITLSATTSCSRSSQQQQQEQPAAAAAGAAAVTPPFGVLVFIHPFKRPQDSRCHTFAKPSCSWQNHAPTKGQDKSQSAAVDKLMQLLIPHLRLKQKHGHITFLGFKRNQILATLSFFKSYSRQEIGFHTISYNSRIILSWRQKHHWMHRTQYTNTDTPWRQFDSAGSACVCSLLA